MADTFTIDTVHSLPHSREGYKLCLANDNGEEALAYFEYKQGDRPIIHLEVFPSHRVRPGTLFTFENVQSFNAFCYGRDFYFSHYRVYSEKYLRKGTQAPEETTE